MMFVGFAGAKDGIIYKGVDKESFIPLNICYFATNMKEDERYLQGGKVDKLTS
jgi:hypothetical protein